MTTGLDHVSLSVSDFAAARAFYDKALAPLGIQPLMTFDFPGGSTCGLGTPGAPFLWISSGAEVGHQHVALRADSRADVDAFYQAAMAAGGKDNGGPGLRPNYHPDYYAAFVLDPDGHNIEAVCHAAA